MGDFNFLNDKSQKANINEKSSVEQDHVAMYFAMRQKCRKESIGSSSRTSSLSLLSLNRTSFLGEPLKSCSCNGRDCQSCGHKNCGVFKRPKTPPIRNVKQSIDKTGTSGVGDDIESILKAELAKADDVLSRAKLSKEDNGSTLGADCSELNVYNILAPSWSPQTPHPFRDELGSITPETTPTSTANVPSGDSWCDFPLRDQADVLSLLQKDEKKFIPNTSGFSHNSDISHFSGVLSENSRPSSHTRNGNKCAELSIGEFFGLRSDSISSITRGKEMSTRRSKSFGPFESKICNKKGESTMSAIHNLLDEDALSGTAICEKLLSKQKSGDELLGLSRVKDLTFEASRLNIDGLSQSRQSTPVASRIRVPASQSGVHDVTPMRRGREYQRGRVPFNIESTPLANSTGDIRVEEVNDGSKEVWQQLRQSVLEISDEATVQEDIIEELEQTIAAGDLTVLSQRIGNMTTASVTSKPSSRHSPLLAIVKTLSDLPTGTVDCAALTPLIRDEFPELLLEWQNTSDLRYSNSSEMSYRPALSFNPGSWVQMTSEPQRVTACVQTTKMASIPVASKDRWLLLRVVAVELLVAGVTIHGEKRNDSWTVDDYIVIKTKEVVLPPNVEHCIHLSLVCQKALNAALRVVLQANDLQSGRSQVMPALLFLTAVLPPHGFSLFPSPSYSFGTLPDDCHEVHPFKLTYLGDCDVPLFVSITEEQRITRAFQLTKNVSVNGSDCKDIIWKDGAFQATMAGGKKQTLEFEVRFSSNGVQNLEERHSVGLEGEVRIELRTVEHASVPVARCQLHGAAAYAKFLCRADCSPVIFHGRCPGVPITKPFHLKNVGAIPLKVALHVGLDPSNSELANDDLFSVPDMVAIPVDEKLSFDITFTPRSGENYFKRYMIMHLEPNGKVAYDVELIGILSSGSDYGTHSSRASVKSGSSAISTNSKGFPVKLSSTNLALSWMATPLQKSVYQSFQVKMKAQEAAAARISVTPDLGAFKIINEKGEAMCKVRKTLKPDIPITINVQFKPNSIGLHHNDLMFEVSGSTDPKTISLTGFGGCPKLRIEDTLLDLHGNRMVKMGHPRSDSFLFNAQFRITNYGNAPGFVFITPTANVLSVAHMLKVFPLQSVLEPNSNIIITLSQHLTNVEFREMLIGQDIRKLATLNVIMGDEPSRQRFRRYASSKPFIADHNRKLIEEFPGEKTLNLENTKESKDFESLFLNSLVSHDVVAVIEKIGGTGDQTAIDFDESSYSFATLSETVLVRELNPSASSDYSANGRSKKSPNTSYSSADDLNSKKVHDWLRKVE